MIAFLHKVQEKRNTRRGFATFVESLDLPNNDSNEKKVGVAKLYADEIDNLIERFTQKCKTSGIEPCESHLLADSDLRRASKGLRATTPNNRQHIRHGLVCKRSRTAGAGLLALKIKEHLLDVLIVARLKKSNLTVPKKLLEAIESGDDPNAVLKERPNLGHIDTPSIAAELFKIYRRGGCAALALAILDAFCKTEDLSDRKWGEVFGCVQANQTSSELKNERRKALRVSLRLHFDKFDKSNGRKTGK